MATKKSITLSIAAGVLLFSFVVLTPLSPIAQGGSPALTTAYAATPTASAPTTNSSSPTSSTCTFSLWSPFSTVASFFSPTCWGRTIATVIGTALIWLGSWVLYWAGLLFDWVMTDTVLQFSNFITSSVLTTINTAWSAFRDISNIVIIGMFTFIAIMTILGNTEYGYKKLLSRVLIVAVLINFSLLFTKIIIDASNFTAVQFLNAAAASTTNCTGCSQLNSTAAAGSVSVQQQTTGQTTGIAGAFLTYAGAQSFGNTFNALNNVAQDPNNGGWYALLYGFIISTLEIVAAIVLLYGTFLLTARALLFIFLMVLSSLAFASYLLPSSWQGTYGWSMWWQTLLKNAVFAPLLAVLLWVTLTVAQAFHASTNANSQVMSLGALLSNQQGQTASLGVEALFGYLVVIGLLYVSFRLSSSFATSIGGLNIAQWSWDNMSSGAFSMLRDQTYGRWVGNRTKQVAGLRNDAADARASARIHENAGNMELANFALNHAMNLERQARQLERRGALGAVKSANALPAPKRVEVVASSTAQDQEKVRREAQNEQRENLQQQKEAMVTAARESAAAAGKALEGSKNELARNNPEYAQARDDLAAATKEREQAAKEHDQAIKDLREQFASSTDQSQRALIEKQINESAESHKSDMRARDQKIEQAKNRTRDLESKSSTVMDLQKFYGKRVQELEERQSEFASSNAQKVTRAALEAPVNDVGEFSAAYRGRIKRDVREDLAGGSVRVVRAEVIPPARSKQPLDHTEVVIREDRPPFQKVA